MRAVCGSGEEGRLGFKHRPVRRILDNNWMDEQQPVGSDGNTLTFETP